MIAMMFDTGVRLYCSVKLISKPVDLDSHVRLISSCHTRHWKFTFHFSNEDVLPVFLVIPGLNDIID